MDAFASSSFPPLVSSQSILGAHPDAAPAPSVSGPPIWKDLFSSSLEKAKSFPLSFFDDSSNEVIFSDEDIEAGKTDWELSLVGYAIGKRPFYGSLLAAVKKKWNFKGALDLLSLSGDFFLFKFSCQEDYDMVWDNGTCFLFGRPFLFKRWNWNFRPVKEEFSELPLWIKLPDFPLCLWNETGISKVASKIGLPLAVDNLTASKSRLTFARVCVQVNPSSQLPSSIPLILNGVKIEQPVWYDWKPKSCCKCSTFSHDDSSCPSNPAHLNVPRARSRSRPGRGRAKRPHFTYHNPRQNLNSQVNVNPFDHLASMDESTQEVAPVLPTPSPAPASDPSFLATLNPSIPLSSAQPPPSISSIPSSSRIVNDLNHPPVSSPPLLVEVNPVLSSSSDTREESPPQVDNEIVTVSSLLSNQVLAMSPSHSHALRSLDPNLKSPSKGQASEVEVASNSSLATGKGKKKSKK